MSCDSIVWSCESRIRESVFYGRRAKKSFSDFLFFPSSGFSIELGTSGLNDHIWRTNLTVAIATKVFKTFEIVPRYTLKDAIYYLSIVKLTIEARNLLTFFFLCLNFILSLQKITFVITCQVNIWNTLITGSDWGISMDYIVAPSFLLKSDDDTKYMPPLWGQNIFFGITNRRSWTILYNKLGLTLFPTGNGLNQPIYSYQVTQAGRNRVKAAAVAAAV